MLMIRNLNLINVQSWTYLDKVGRGRLAGIELGRGWGSWGGGEVEGPGSRIELTFLSLEAVAKYLSSPLHAHAHIILAC